MTAQLPIPDQMQELEELIIKQDEIPFAQFSEWRSHCQRIGESLADYTFWTIAQKYDSFIVSNRVNPDSFSHFFRSDVQSKTLHIRQKSFRAGIRSGFLEPVSSEIAMKPISFWIKGHPFYAVLREGNECLVKNPVSTDLPLTVPCYEDGSYIISDIDLVSIYFRNPTDQVLQDPIYGELTELERSLILDLNQYFQELVCNFRGSSILFKLVAHGPANRFSKAKKECFHWPMKINTPFSTTEFINSTEGFLQFHQKMKSLGYHGYLNPQWKLSL